MIFKECKLIKLERATVQDKEVITEIHTKAFNDEMQTVLGRNGGPPGYDSIKENLRIINEYLTYIIIQETKIVGFFFLIPIDKEHFSLESLCLYPEYQNRGLGYQTLCEMEKIHPEIKRWSLVSMKGSDRIQHLYEKFGYNSIGEDEWFIKYEKLIK